LCGEFVKHLEKAKNGQAAGRPGISVTPGRKSAELARISGRLGAQPAQNRYNEQTSKRGFRRIEMSKLKLVAAVAALSAVTLASSLAEARTHHRYHRHYANPLPYPISYLHNYGPGITPGTFAYYDGPSANRCYQSAAAYIGQDGRRHPCN
jgi:hypothetical protein